MGMIQSFNCKLLRSLKLAWWIVKDKKYPHFCLLQVDSIMLQTSGIITRQTRFLDNVIGQTWHIHRQHLHLSLKSGKRINKKYIYMYRPVELLPSQKQSCWVKHQALTLYNPLIKGVWLFYARPSYPTWLKTKIIPCFGKWIWQASQ